jgi:hypothetical protein
MVEKDICVLIDSETSIMVDISINVVEKSSVMKEV